MIITIIIIIIMFDMLVLDSVRRKFALPNPLPDVAALFLSLPIKAGGFGLTKVAAVSIPAYFCALSEASEAIVDLLPPEKADHLLLGDEKQRAPFAKRLLSVSVPSLLRSMGSKAQSQPP